MTGAQLKLALVMSPLSLLSQLIGNHLSPTEVVVTPNLIAIAVATTGNACCPVCGQPSDHVHSPQSISTCLADLPVCGRQLVLFVPHQKFFCTNAGYPRQIFCKRIPDMAAPHVRPTQRLSQHHRTRGLALGGEPASQLTMKLAMRQVAMLFSDG
ncbi:MAG: transposase family protein [Planctomycetes bacterium]|nr:transposase family protein [Planctomycetota bacterium]